MRSETRTQTSAILGAEGWPSPVEGVRLEIRPECRCFVLLHLTA